jgi:hypothetical protein
MIQRKIDWGNVGSLHDLYISKSSKSDDAERLTSTLMSSTFVSFRTSQGYSLFFALRDVGIVVRSSLMKISASTKLESLRSSEMD